MKVLVTGSAGHLGEGLMRRLPHVGHEPLGLDVAAGPFTQRVGSIRDRAFVKACLSEVAGVIHTATLHKPHIATHSRQDFIDSNISGTLNLLEEAVSAEIAAFVFTSSTSAFGAALTPPPGAPALWIDETVRSLPKNIYGVTKTAAEDLCELFHRRFGLNCIVLRSARFFPEEDDNRGLRAAYVDENAKANEFLFRRVDLEDAVSAHVAAIEKASALGFGRYIISATSPFVRDDLAFLRSDPAAVAAKYFAKFQRVFGARGFQMFPAIERVYVNAKARQDLAWRPRYDFGRILEQLSASEPIGSKLARQVGVKGYHAETFEDGPYPVE